MRRHTSPGLRLALAGTIAAVVASLTAGPTAGTAAAPAPAADRASARGGQTAKLYMHPQLAQAGRAKRSANSAESSMSATFRPVRKGRPVLLQQRRGDRWVTIRRGRQNGRGIAEFNAAYKRNGRVQVYRARTVGTPGLRRITSARVAADRWGRADFTDQFNGSRLGDAWSHRRQDFNSTRYRKCSRSGARRAARVGKGTLRLQVLFDKGPNPRTRPRCKTPDGKFRFRVNGHISTSGKESFRYGYAAARIKWQPRAGQHGAFWMQPDGSRPRAGRGPGSEIDVIEWFGNRRNNDTELTSFVHHRGNKIGGFIKDPGRYGGRWASRYHVYSVDWTPSRYIFRIDGKETFRTSRGVSHRPEFLILSLMSSDYELPLLGNGKLPQTMKVDWVRYWKRG